MFLILIGFVMFVASQRGHFLKMCTLYCQIQFNLLYVLDLISMVFIFIFSTHWTKHVLRSLVPVKSVFVKCAVKEVKLKLAFESSHEIPCALP